MYSKSRFIILFIQRAQQRGERCWALSASADCCGRSSEAILLSSACRSRSLRFNCFSLCSSELWAPQAAASAPRPPRASCSPARARVAVLVHLRRLRYLRFQLTVSGQRVISLALRVHFLQPEMAEREWHRLRVDLRRDR